MKIFTKYYVLYLVLFAVYTIVFRYLLSSSLDAEHYTRVWIYAILYGLVIFITAWNLGKADGIKRFRFDAGTRFHAGTYLVWGIISELWFLLDLGSSHETIRIVHFTLIFWGFFLMLHFIFFFFLRKRTIKGIHKSELFD